MKTPKLYQCKQKTELNKKRNRNYTQNEGLDINTESMRKLI